MLTIWRGVRRLLITTPRTFTSVSVSSRLRRGHLLLWQHHLRCCVWYQPSDPRISQRRRRRRLRKPWRRRTSRLRDRLPVLWIEVYCSQPCSKPNRVLRQKRERTSNSIQRRKLRMEEFVWIRAGRNRERRRSRCQTASPVGGRYCRACRNRRS